MNNSRGIDVEVLKENLNLEDEISFPPAKKLGELVTHLENDPLELFKNRFLCQGGVMLLVAPSGVGKSTFGMGMAIAHASGDPYLGIVPAKELKYLIIQAENDEGDMAEMRDGMFLGRDLTQQQIAMAKENVIVVQSSQHTGKKFADVLKHYIEMYRPDIVIIDPFLSFLGADVNSQKDVSYFVRNLLQPIVQKFGVGLIVVHHTSKPKAKDKGSKVDQSYVGMGSSELTNWPRGILTLEKTAEQGIFILHAAKRGARLGWKSPDGQTVFFKMIRHSSNQGEICWSELSPEESAEIQESVVAKRRGPTDDDVLGIFPSSFEKTNKFNAHAPTPRECVLNTDQVKAIFTKKGWGKDNYLIFLKKLLDQGLLQQTKKRNKNYYGRPEQMMAFNPQ